MPFAALLGGTIVPVLLMLSPLAVMAASECRDWTPAPKAADGTDDRTCTPPLPPLM